MHLIFVSLLSPLLVAQMTCDKNNYVRRNDECIECEGGGSMLMAMYPVISVSFVAFLSVLACMWTTKKDEMEDLAEDQADNEKRQQQEAQGNHVRSAHGDTALDHAKSAHHHDHMARRAAAASRSVKSIKRAKGMSTKQKVARDILNQYVIVTFLPIPQPTPLTWPCVSPFVLCRSKIIVGWAQIVGSLSITFSSVPWPKVFLEYTLSFGAIFNLNVGALFAFTNCQLNLPFLDGYVIHLLLLFLLCLAVVVGYGLALLCWGRKDAELAKQYKQICVKILIMLIMFLYPSICVKTFTGLRCTSVTPFAMPDGTNTTLRVMSEDWNVLCDSGATYWYNYTTLIYIVMGLIVAGVPLGILVTLAIYRKHLFDSTSEQHEATLEMFGPLFVQYEEECWFFEVFVVLEKMILTGGMCLVADGSAIQTLSALLVSFFYMMMVLKTGPFLHDNDDVLSFVTSLQLVLTFLGALVLQMDQSIAFWRTKATTDTGAMVDAESMQQFNGESIGYFLIAINVMCLVLMVFSLVAAVAPMVNEYCCKKRAGKSAVTKVNPEHGVISVKEKESTREWK